MILGSRIGLFLTAIREAGRPLCLADLSRELGIDESALEGMVEAEPACCRRDSRTVRRARIKVGPEGQVLAQAHGIFQPVQMPKIVRERRLARIRLDLDRSADRPGG